MSGVCCRAGGGCSTRVVCAVGLAVGVLCEWCVL